MGDVRENGSIFSVISYMPLMFFCLSDLTALEPRSKSDENLKKKKKKFGEKRSEKKVVKTIGIGKTFLKQKIKGL